jgi:hypothetical protein
MATFKKKSIYFFFICIVTTCFSLITGCRYNSESRFIVTESGRKLKIQLKKIAINQYTLEALSYRKDTLFQTSSWPFSYEVFKLDTGDVNNDYSTDILVGVIKKTRFDTICRKRIFIFKLVEGYIRPLWLGSRVSQPLEDFRYCRSQSYGIIRTIEMERNKTYLVAEYRWKGFGLEFIRYLARELPLRKAEKIFKTN